jgi:plastocyanin
MYKARVLMTAALVAAVGCGGGGGDGGGGTGPSVYTSLTVAPSSVTMLVNDTQALTATARDQSNATLSGLAVTYTSSNQAVATVSTAGLVTAVSVGTAKITASGTIGTVTKTTDVDVSVIVPGPTASVSATASNSFEPKSAVITKGGSVTWTFAALHNVTFDVAGAPANISDKSSGSASLTFPTAGTFPYHCTIHGQSMSGTIRVQ